MRTTRLGFAAFSLALLTAACGGGDSSSTTGPSPVNTSPSPQTVVVVSGENLVPVTGAIVRAGGQQVTTASDGTAVFQNLASNSQVSIEAAGFISPRQTRLNGSPLTLIPDGLHFIELVYGDWPHLVRWQQSTEIPFYLPEDLREPGIVHAHQDAIQLASTGGATRLVIVD